MAQALRTMRLSGIALALAVAASACAKEPADTLLLSGTTGGDDTTHGSTSTDTSTGTDATPSARDMFIQKVYPSLNDTCSDCHSGSPTGVPGPQLFTDTAEGTYTYLDTQTDYITLPDNSVLYLHALQPHTGPAYTSEQASLVKTWLDAEAEARGLTGTGAGGGGPTGGMTLAGAVQQFGGCMALDDWTANNLQQIQNTQVDGGQRCRDCHSSGQNNAWLNGDGDAEVNDADIETFEMNRTYPYIMRLVSGTVDEDGNFQDLVESKRFIQKGQEACLQPPCHPKFELAQELKDGLHSFFQTTKAKYDQGPCDVQQGGGGAGGGN